MMTLHIRLSYYGFCVHRYDVDNAGSSLIEEQSQLHDPHIFLLRESHDVQLPNSFDNDAFLLGKLLSRETTRATDYPVFLIVQSLREAIIDLYELVNEARLTPHSIWRVPDPAASRQLTTGQNQLRTMERTHRSRISEFLNMMRKPARGERCLPEKIGYFPGKIPSYFSSVQDNYEFRVPSASQKRFQRPRRHTGGVSFPIVGEGTNRVQSLNERGKALEMSNGSSPHGNDSSTFIASSALHNSTDFNQPLERSNMGPSRCCGQTVKKGKLSFTPFGSNYCRRIRNRLSESLEISWGRHFCHSNASLCGMSRKRWGTITTRHSLWHRNFPERNQVANRNSGKERGTLMRTLFGYYFFESSREGQTCTPHRASGTTRVDIPRRVDFMAIAVSWHQGGEPPGAVPLLHIRHGSATSSWWSPDENKEEVNMIRQRRYLQDVYGLCSPTNAGGQSHAGCHQHLPSSAEHLGRLAGDSKSLILYEVGLSNDSKRREASSPVDLPPLKNSPLDSNEISLCGIQAAFSLPAQQQSTDTFFVHGATLPSVLYTFQSAAFETYQEGSAQWGQTAAVHKNG